MTTRNPAFMETRTVLLWNATTTLRIILYTRETTTYDDDATCTLIRPFSVLHTNHDNGTTSTITAFFALFSPLLPSLLALSFFCSLLDDSPLLFFDSVAVAQGRMRGQRQICLTTSLVSLAWIRVFFYVSKWNSCYIAASNFKRIVYPVSDLSICDLLSIMFCFCGPRGVVSRKWSPSINHANSHENG